MLDKLNKLEEKALAELRSVGDLEALDAWRIAYLGKKSELTAILRGLGALSREERPAVGQRANEVKERLEKAYQARAEELRLAALQRHLEAGAIDVTLPGRPQSLGHLHLTTQILRRIYAICAEMGFQVLETREVESDEYNFQLLNIPPYHPARDMWSTFYTTREGVLLRTHTSPGQIHAMRQYAPQPIRLLLPGKCYRYEQVTARAESMFYQVEGLAVGPNITMADLKGTLTAFAQRMFGADRKVRFRCSYFPFTEPSVEVDIDCIICAGQGCRVCKHTGWLEILGAGMVHPYVLANGGYDPQKFSGYAWGMGPERIAMLIHRIDDIRYFYSNDVRFLSQFG
ncbi:MAG: phenylalanine--tRNA ligase subunit alpha [Chloroflexi bacterium]|nr:phenylalanine--tRNA ligase subunit alpha [Chloroflexota bacterium]